MTIDFEERLKALRSQYLTNPSEQDEPKTADERLAKFDQAHQEFMSLSLEDKIKKVNTNLDFLREKLVLLNEELTELRQANADNSEIKGVLDHIDAVNTKITIFEQKLDFIESGEYDSAKKDKIKKQLTELELKRCKFQLGKKDCSRLNEKIALKKELFKKTFK